MNGTSCQECLIGRYNDQAGSSCQFCEKATFANKTGVSACTPCPIGSSTLAEGSFSLDFCSLCNDGYFGKPPKLPCQLCPPLDAQFTRCNWNDSFPFLVAGNFRVTATTAVTCTPFQACLLTGTNEFTPCAVGYTDIYCGACAYGYYRLNQLCVACPSRIFETLTILAICLIALFVGYKLTYLNTSLDLRLVIQALQIMATFPDITSKWPKALLNLFSFLSITVGFRLFPFGCDLLTLLCF
jgi:hypothetical protein